jgi:hypothetical protein
VYSLLFLFFTTIKEMKLSFDDLLKVNNQFLFKIAYYMIGAFIVLYIMQRWYTSFTTVPTSNVSRGAGQDIRNNIYEHVTIGDCPACPSCTCPQNPACPVCPPDRTKDVDNLTALSKYLTLIIRQKEAEDEIFRLAQGHARVYTSPKLELINRQIAEFKKRVNSDLPTQRFFEDNLDSSIMQF